MTNEWIFYTQLGSVLVFIISLFVLYRLLVEKKEATIQFLEKQLQAAKEEKPDVVLKQLNERVQIERAEMERLSKDKETLTGITERAYQYISALERVVSADAEVIKLYETQREEMHALTQEQFETFTRDLLDVVGKLEESGTVLVHKDAEGVVRKVTFTPKEETQ